MAAAVGMILAPMLAPLLMPPPPPPAPIDILLPAVLIGGAVVVAVVLTKKCRIPVSSARSWGVTFSLENLNAFIKADRLELKTNFLINLIS